MVTTMALVWTVNSTLSCGCKIPELHIFAPPNAAPCTVPPGADAPFAPPVPAATGGYDLYPAIVCLFCLPVSNFT